MRERLEACKEEKVLSVCAVYVFCATSSYVVVMASKIKVIHVFKYYSSNFL